MRVQVWEGPQEDDDIIMLRLYQGPAPRGLQDGVADEEVVASLSWRPISPDAQTRARDSGCTALHVTETGRLEVETRLGSRFSVGIVGGEDSAPFVELGVKETSGLYGLGAGSGAPNRNRVRVILLNRDTLFYTVPDAAYSSFPVFIVRVGARVLGVLWNACRPAEITTSEHSRDVEIRIRPLKGEWLGHELFVVEGSSKSVLARLTQLVGRPPLPPVWALGFHQSRWSYKNEMAVRRIAAGMRRYAIPCDAIHLDIHYMKGYRVFSWNRRRFPDPTRLFRELRQAGIRVVAIVDPGIKREPRYALYAEGIKNGYFCTAQTGGVYEGRVWPGVCVFPDFERAEARRWWEGWIRRLIAQGVAGIWNDMNEPVLKMGRDLDPLGEDIRHVTGPHWAVRNRYATRQAEASFTAIAKETGERPFVLTRSGNTGIQKYAWLWTGDNQTSWEHLKINLNMVINLGLSGMPLTGADVGGFCNATPLPSNFKVFKWRKQPELFCRWVQLGSLMPFFRIHTSLFSHAQEPWSFGTEALAVARKHIMRRYSLLPYLYATVWEAHRRGTPLVRPMFMEDATLPEVDDQFFLGPDLLAAPVFEPGQRTREVMIPEGRWIDFETGEIFSSERGCREVSVPVRLDYYPLLVREGAVLPVAAPRSNAEATLASQVALEVYLTENTQALSGLLVSDDGRSLHGEGEAPPCILHIRGERCSNGEVHLHAESATAQNQPHCEWLSARLPMPYWRGTIAGRESLGTAENLGNDHRTIEWIAHGLPQGPFDAHFVPAGLF